MPSKSVPGAQGLQHTQGLIAGNGKRLARLLRTGIVHAHRVAICRDQRPTRATGVNARIVLQHLLHRCPRRVAIGLGLGNNAFGQGVFGVAQRMARRVNREAYFQRAG